MFTERVNELESPPEESFCGYPYFTTYAAGDGNLYRCCNTAYTTRGKLGSLENGLQAIWPTKLDGFDAKKCRVCQFKEQNKAIAAAIRPPKHVNFV